MRVWNHAGQALLVHRGDRGGLRGVVRLIIRPGNTVLMCGTEFTTDRNDLETASAAQTGPIKRMRRMAVLLGAFAANCGPGDRPSRDWEAQVEAVGIG